MPRYNPWKYEPVAYPLTGGVDTKWHGLTLPAPKLQVCENAYVEQTGSIRRRFGRDALANDIQGGGTAVNWVALATYYGNLLGLTGSLAGVGGQAYEYSESAARWISKGDVESVRIRTQNIAKGGGEAGAWAGDSATANGITVHAYEEHEPSGANIQSSVRIMVTDADGVVLKKPYTLRSVTAASATSTFGIKVVARGNILYVFYYNGAANDIKVALINATSAATLGTMEPTPLTLTSDIDATVPCFDVVANATHGIFIAYNDTTANRITYGFVDSAGAGIGASVATQATAADPTSISVAVSPGLAMHGIAYCVGTTPNDVYAMHRSWNGSVWSGLVGPSATLDTALGSAVGNIACAYQSGLSTTLRVFYTEGNATNPAVHQGTYTTGGVVTSRVATIRHSTLTSKPVIGADALLYYWVINGTLALTSQPTNFLVRQDNVLIGKAVDGVALIPVSSQYALAQVQLVGTTFSFTTGYLVGSLPTGSFASNIALKRVSFELAHNDSHAAVESGQSLMMAGGYLQQYDGQSFVEGQFLRPFNSIVVGNPTPATIAGTHLTTLAIYSYRFIWEWDNIRGERVLGTDLGAKTCPALTGTDNKHTFTLPTLAHTRMLSPRGDAVIGVYRTLANPDEDAPHYRIGEVVNDPTANTVSFVDTVSDAIAATMPQCYLDSEVDNTAPPAGHIIASGNGRVFVAGFADMPNVVMASKQRVPGRALEFSDFLPNIVLPEAGGAVTALAVFNRTLMVFTATAVYRVDGDGPNNAGFGEFGTPSIINADTGTIIARSVVVTPFGVFFEGAKGKMVIDTSFNVGYIGAPLEKLTSPGTCKGATLIPNLQQVRFSYATLTHVYDYYHQQWYVFTHDSDGPTVLWNSVLTAIDLDAIVYDAPASWDDAGTAYTMEVKLGWVTSRETRRGDLAIRSIGLTGQSLAAHNLAVYVGYDQGTSAELTTQTASGAGVLEPIWRLGRQFCSSIEVTIRDALIDAYGADVVVESAGMRLNELVFELGVRSSMLGRDV